MRTRSPTVAQRHAAVAAPAANRPARTDHLPGQFTKNRYSSYVLLVIVVCAGGCIQAVLKRRSPAIPPPYRLTCDRDFCINSSKSLTLGLHESVYPTGSRRRTLASVKTPDELIKEELAADGMKSRMDSFSTLWPSSVPSVGRTLPIPPVFLPRRKSPLRGQESS